MYLWIHHIVSAYRLYTSINFDGEFGDSSYVMLDAYAMSKSSLKLQNNIF
jgi:hypothetical protein